MSPHRQFCSSAPFAFALRHIIFVLRNMLKAFSQLFLSPAKDPATRALPPLSASGARQFLSILRGSSGEAGSALQRRSRKPAARLSRLQAPAAPTLVSRPKQATTAPISTPRPKDRQLPRSAALFFLAFPRRLPA